MHIFLHALSLLAVAQCVTVMNINLSALQVRRPEQNSTQRRAVNNCKISGHALKQESRTQSVLYQRSSQLQKRKAAH